MSSPASDPLAPPRFFVLRTPLLSFDEFLAWGQGQSAGVSEGERERLQEAIEEDRLFQRDRLRELVARPEIREALFLASPDLEAALEHWINEPDGEKGLRAERAAVKYLARMAGRATPFGLFAGGCSGAVGEKTRLVLGSREQASRHSRLDMDYLFALSESISRDRSLRRGLLFYPNSTLYRAGERFRYVESRVQKQERRYQLVAVEATPELEATLERATAGALLDDLAAALVSGDISHEEALVFVEELSDSQILLPDTGMVITGEEPASLMTLRLGGHPETSQIAARIGEVNRHLDRIDAEGIGAPSNRYREMAASLQELPAKPDLARLFQVDLNKKSAEVTLGRDVIREIQRGVEVLHKITPAWKSSLPAFREAFSERYEEREIPLVEALDEERGIGFPAFENEDDASSPLLKGVQFPGAPDDAVRWGPREEHLLKRLAQTLQTGAIEMVLDDGDLEKLTNKGQPPPPRALAAMVRVMAASEAELDNGNFRVLLESAGGPSGALFLGRFCHGDPALHHLVKEHLAAVQALEPETVFAEVVHLPDGRTGNVIQRPLFHEYEIPYLGASGAPRERQIPVTDLLISVRGDEITLRSRRLSKRIIPRLTTAHNFAHYGLSLYRFLCTMQSQNTAGGLLWKWTRFSAAPFLPRVRHGRTVLAPAQWTVETGSLKKLPKRLDAQAVAEVRCWRARHGIPRLVMVGDLHELPVDFDSVLSTEAFLGLIRNQESVELREMLPGPDQLCAKGPEGRYVHEIVVPFEGTKQVAARPMQRSAGAVKRTFFAGSEWLYAKFYGGNISLDRALARTIGPFAVKAVESGRAESWFFVRYADPRPHLRVRFSGDPRALAEALLPEINRMADQLRERGEIWKMQLDTYEREVERYGGADGIRVAEEIFHVDSEAVLEILRMLEEGETGQEERWRMALAGCDALLDDFGLSLDEKRSFAGRARDAYGAGQVDDPVLKRTLGERFRKEGRELLPLLDRKRLERHPLRPGMDVLAARSSRIGPAVEGLRVAEKAGRLDRPISVIAGSFVHMFLNRMFIAAHRKQEVVVYDFLKRLYDSMAARIDG